MQTFPPCSCLYLGYLLLFILVFAVVGCCLFSSFQPSAGSTLPYGGGTLNTTVHSFVGYASHHASPFGVTGIYSAGNTHFGDFGHSLLVLVRIMSIDHWSEIYHDCVSTEDAAEVPAALFFILFIVVTGPIIGSLSVSVVQSVFLRKYSWLSTQAAVPAS